MLDFINPNALTITATSVAVAVTFAACILAFMQVRQAKNAAKIARISVEREYYERAVRDLTERMSHDQARWMDLNHLILDSLRAQSTIPSKNLVQTEELGPKRLFDSLGLTLGDLQVQSDQVFILTPFSKAYQVEYKQIADACLEVGLVPRRGDEVRISGSILPHIIRGIATSRFVIANISGRNPNVFYELGLAQAMGKPAIIVSRDFSTVPFDLRQQQLVLFEKQGELKERVKEAMLRLFADLGRAAAASSPF